MKLIGGAGKQDDKQDAVHELYMVSVPDGFFRLHGWAPLRFIDDVRTLQHLFCLIPILKTNG